MCVCVCARAHVHYVLENKHAYHGIIMPLMFFLSLCNSLHVSHFCVLVKRFDLLKALYKFYYDYYYRTFAVDTLAIKLKIDERMLGGRGRGLFSDTRNKGLNTRVKKSFLTPLCLSLLMNHPP